MNYINRLIETENSKKIPQFLNLCKNPTSVQKEVLLDILNRNKNCELGKRFGFESIKTPDEFREKVPVTEWEFYREDVSRMMKGETDILFSGPTEYFIHTSGTEGSNKSIPESAMGRVAKNLVMNLRNLYIMQKYPELLKGKFLPLSNSAVVGYTEADIPIGTASGLTTEDTDKDLLDRYNACPLPVKRITDSLANDYTTMRFSMEQDVRGITGNNIGRLVTMVEVANEYAGELIKDIENGTLSNRFNIDEEIREALKPYLKPNRDKAEQLKTALEKKGKFVPSLFWPNLKVIRCWLSGSIGQYVNRAKRLLDDYEHEIVFIDAGYGASEGKFNIPLQENRASAPVALFGAFYEFIEVGDKSGKTHFLWELEDKREYRIIVTTYSGLYRYDLHDIIRVNGFTYETPNIEFVSKTQDIANICGEKMSADLLVRVFAEALSINKTDARHFCVFPDVENARYLFFVEPADKSLNYEELLRTIEKLMHKYNDLYTLLRGQNLLSYPGIVKMKKGWQQALYKQRIKDFSSISQVKLPVVCREKPDSRWIDEEL